MKAFLEEIATHQHCQTVEDLYAALGYGGIQLWRLMPRIRDNYNKIKKPVEESQEIRYQKAPSKATGGVIIDGIDNCLIKFSKCCNPLPGDDIIGFITRGYGVSIHKRSCTNVPKDTSKAAEPERWVNARWAGDIQDEFESTLEILASDRTGLLADLTNQLSSMHIFIHALNSRELKDNNAIIYATITVNGLEHLKSVISRLSNISGIISIGRS